MSNQLLTDGPPQSAPVAPRRVGAKAVAFALVLVLLFAGGFALVRWVIDPNSTTTQRSSSAPATPTDPASSVLPGLVLQQPDVGANLSVQLLRSGTQVRGQATLDLCNGRFPSETRRTARLQDALVDSQGNELMSTEAVLYSSPASTTQAFSELRAVVASCPSSAVRSPVGEPTVTTHFDAAPDASWAQTPTVERQAYSFTTTDQSGRSAPGIAVYLRRGRALMGIYFAQPTAAPPAIRGQTSIEGIVTLFATRLSQLPATTVGGP